MRQAFLPGIVASPCCRPAIHNAWGYRKLRSETSAASTTRVRPRSTLPPGIAPFDRPAPSVHAPAASPAPRRANPPSPCGRPARGYARPGRSPHAIAGAGQLIASVSYDCAKDITTDVLRPYVSRYRLEILPGPLLIPFASWPLYGSTDPARIIHTAEGAESAEYFQRRSYGRIEELHVSTLCEPIGSSQSPSLRPLRPLRPPR